MVGSHGNEKLQPFMVGFFRAHTPPPSPLSHVKKEMDSDVDDDEEEDVEDNPRTASRIRRQTSKRNRKRRKDSEDYGTWNPYTGKQKWKLASEMDLESIRNQQYVADESGKEI